MSEPVYFLTLDSAVIDSDRKLSELLYINCEHVNYLPDDKMRYHIRTKMILDTVIEDLTKRNIFFDLKSNTNEKDKEKTQTDKP